MTNKKVIFKVEYGGLGDHLFYSALPRLLKEQNLADEVYISDQSNFRNPAIFDLIWKVNPHNFNLHLVRCEEYKCTRFDI